MNNLAASHTPQSVLSFWFPEGSSPNVDRETHHQHWVWRMRGKADAQIVARFGELTYEAAEGLLSHWAETPEGRLALIVVLDQFSRAVFRDSPRAYAQDLAALQLTLEGLKNGHYETLPAPWFKIVFGLPLGHCEGPDHLQRLDLLLQLRQQIHAEAPDHLKPIYASLITQAEDVRSVIQAFGRHPHRNALLGRESTPAERAYIEKGEFPHQRAFQR